MVNCSVLTCTNKSEVQNCKEHGISYFKFRENSMVEWIKATGRGAKWKPCTSSSICSEHFDVECFEQAALRRRLQTWAMPTLKLPVQKSPGEEVEESAEPTKSKYERVAYSGPCYSGPKMKQDKAVPESPAGDKSGGDGGRAETPAEPDDRGGGGEARGGAASDGARSEQNVPTSRKQAQSMDRNELERFKRRLIRIVARLRAEKCCSLWAQVEKDMGKSCRSMWMRMRQLTLKKMSRLLQCDDVPARLSPVARMSITDWLLLDLVLVHEDIDSTGTAAAVAETGVAPQSRPLSALLELVQEFDLENSGTAENWARAAMHYNQRGKQCSPMLLQRRWFDLKLITRKRFYHYWDTHRRDPKTVQPTQLSIEIARRYPHVVTKVLPSWNEMRKSGRVILPNEFEKILRFKDNPKSIDDDADDVVLIEPNIETIDVDLLSELEEEATENVTECNTEMIDLHIDTSPRELTEIEISALEIKKEEIHLESLTIEDSDVSDDYEINIFENDPAAPLQTEPEMYPESSTDTIDHATNERDDQNHLVALPVILKVESVLEDSQTDVQKALISSSNTEPTTNESIISENISLYGQYRDCTEQEIIEPPNETIEGIFDTYAHNSLIEEDLECTQPTIPTRPGPKSMKHILSTTRKTPNETKKSHRPGPKCSKSSLYIEVNSGSFSKLLVRDSAAPISPIIYADVKSHSAHIDLPKSSMTKETSVETDEPTPSTSKEFYNRLDTSIDEFNECDSDFMDNEIEEAVHIDEATLKSIQQEHINTVLTEEKDNIGESTPSAISVPSSPLDLGQEEHSRDSTSIVSQKFDLKLLMLPVVYTKKLDDMEVFKNNSELKCTVLNSVTSLEDVEAQSRPKSSKGIELNIHEEMDHSDHENMSDIYAEECLNDNDNYAEGSNEINIDDEIIKEPQVIKESSYHFQKPITRCYNPIKLCKNPDFNTRLRRLSVAFYMKSRNRQLIKACKPLTVDVHKTFEEKLVSGMLLLKCSDKKQVKNVTTDNIVTNDIDSQSVTVTPSAMPAQTLFDKEKVDINELTKVVHDSKQVDDIIPLKARQNKSINLPDIEKVRLINKQLLTAQVPPLQVSEPIANEDRVNKNIHIFQPKRPTQVYEVLRGPQGVEYKRQDDSKIKEKLKIKEPKLKIKEPKRKALSKPLDVPWYRPDYRKTSNENYLLKEDALQRMISALTPEALPYRSPVRKLSYCCTAKRHKVLNDARCRLLINTKGELRRRRFQKELKVHKCLPQDCKCCCKSLLPKQEPKPSPETQPQEESAIEMPANQPQSVDPDSEIANALAGLEPTRDPSPVSFNQPAVGLAPIVKTPQKQDQDVVTPMKSSPNEVQNESQPHSILVPTKSYNYGTNTENEKENPKGGASAVSGDVIELDDDSDEDTIKDNTFQSDTESANSTGETSGAEVNQCKNNQKDINVDNSTNVDKKQGSVNKSIDVCEDSENNLPKTKAFISKARRRQVRKRKEKTDTKSSRRKAQLLYWENVKETSKTAYGFDIKKAIRPKTSTRVIMPQLVPIQNKIIDTSSCNIINECPSPSTYIETQPSIVENGSLDFPPGTKFMLLTNGQVFATTAEGIPITLSESQYAALQLVINNVHGHSNVPTQNTGISDSTSSTMGTLSVNGQAESYFPIVEINDIDSPVNSDQVLVNTAHVSVSMQSKKYPSSKNNSNNFDIIESTADAQAIENTNISSIKEINLNNGETQASGDKLKRNAEIDNVASQSVVEFTNLEDLNFEDQNKNSYEPIENQSTMELTDNAKSIIEIADSPENHTSCTQDNGQNTTNKFLTVKNFAKMPLTRSANSEGSQSQSSVPTNRNSILSDLMEISGISSEDANAPAPTDLGVMPCLGVVQEWTNVGSNDPNSLVLTPNPNTQPNTIGVKGQFYMYNSVTGQVTPITVIHKSPVKPKHPNILRKEKSTTLLNMGVVEVYDSESEKEMPHTAAANQLLKLLKKKKQKKKLKRLFKLKNFDDVPIKDLPLILKKQSTLGKYEHAMYSEFMSKKCNVRKKRGRKPQVEAKIDLVDSDAPMEEEYLVDSQESDTESNLISNIRIRPKRKRHMPTRATVSVDIDDSSDDEPLSKIAAKKISLHAAENVDVSPAITVSNIDMSKTRNPVRGSPLESNTKNEIAQDEVVSENANPNSLTKNTCDSSNDNEGVQSKRAKSFSIGQSDDASVNPQQTVFCNVNDSSNTINMFVQETDPNVSRGDISAVCENDLSKRDNVIDSAGSADTNCLNVNSTISTVLVRGNTSAACENDLGQIEDSIDDRESNETQGNTSAVCEIDDNIDDADCQDGDCILGM